NNIPNGSCALMPETLSCLVDIMLKSNLKFAKSRNLFDSSDPFTRLVTTCLNLEGDYKPIGIFDA
ncbi:MAG TPA: hypothetical protein PLJ00_12250, partial [Chitinophagales bacterium]|nr:hypothetical protein [Chitinophagales bacterium]HRG86649.1 hypothetical protein [Chitinophagales bacterium]